MFDVVVEQIGARQGLPEASRTAPADADARVQSPQLAGRLDGADRRGPTR
jgi:hypothetical protein